MMTACAHSLRPASEALLSCLSVCESRFRWISNPKLKWDTLWRHFELVRGEAGSLQYGRSWSKEPGSALWDFSDPDIKKYSRQVSAESKSNVSKDTIISGCGDGGKESKQWKGTGGVLHNDWQVKLVIKGNFYIQKVNPLVLSTPKSILKVPNTKSLDLYVCNLVGSPCPTGVYL